MCIACHKSTALSCLMVAFEKDETEAFCLICCKIRTSVDTKPLRHMKHFLSNFFYEV